MKTQGPIWLGLTAAGAQHPGFAGIADIHAMVSRSAYAQLALFAGPAGGDADRHGPDLLGAAVAGAVRPRDRAGCWRWRPGPLMAVSFWPILRFYGLTPLWAPALPAIATGYMAFTLSSALQHRRGRGGRWKGRYQAEKPEERCDGSIGRLPVRQGPPRREFPGRLPARQPRAPARHHGVLRFRARRRRYRRPSLACRRTTSSHRLDRMEASLTGSSVRRRAVGAAARSAGRATSCRPSMRSTCSTRSGWT